MKPFLLISVILFQSLIVLGQTPNIENGTKPYGAYDSTQYDTVNLSNGNVVLDIPLVSYSQLGGRLTLDYDIFYTAKQWNIIAEGASIQQWAIGSSADPSLFITNFFNPGASGVSIIDTQTQMLQPLTFSPPTYGNGGSRPYQFKEWYMYDSRGGAHPMAVASTGGLRSVDGSGYYVNGTITPPAANSSVEEVTLSYTSAMDRQGLSSSYPATTRSDSNGNSITYQANGNPYISGNVTDTIGRSIPTPSFVAGFNPLISITPPVSSANCSGPLPITAAYLWSVPSLGTGNVQQYKFCFATVNIATNFRSVIGSGVEEASYTALMLQSIVLPNLSTWTFQYNDRDDSDPSTINYGTLTSITTPLGASIQYKYGMVTTCTKSSPPVSRGIISRTIIAGPGAIPQIWTYKLVAGGANSSIAVTDTVTDPMANDTVHGFVDFGFCQYYETSTQNYQGSSSGGSILKTTTTAYSTNSNVAVDVPGTPQTSDILPKSITTTWPGGQSSYKGFAYDQTFIASDPNASLPNVVSNTNTTGTSLGERNSLVESDFSLNPIRTTTSAYKSNDGSSNATSYLAANLLDLPSSVIITASGPTTAAETDYKYDEAGSPQGAHGNRTSVNKVSSTGPSPVTHTVYTSQGVPSQWQDANGNLTYVSSWQCSNLFPQQVISAYQSQTTVPETSSSVYDCNTGKLLSSTDSNGVATKYSYVDPLQRLTLIQRGLGTSAETWNAVSYPSMTQVNIAQDKNTKGDGILQSSVLYDGLGRKIHETGPNGATVDTVYDPIGRVYSVSNPHFSSASPTDGVSTTTYDALDRPLFQYHPDNTFLQWTYTGAVTDSFDEIGRHWRRTSDALGRLTEVLEPSGGTNMTVSPTLETDYVYDALDNLKTITQHGASTDTPRVRSFSYDSLSRLLTSTNPETGTVCYGIWSGSSCVSGYDPNGNLLAKTDARLTTVNFTYDALNRVITKTSSGGTGVAGFTYNYTYDQASQSGFTSAYPVGRLVSATNNVNANVLYSYDPLGRVLTQQGATPTEGSSNANPVSASYDLAGDMTSITYPDGRTVSQGFDSAGRLSSVNYASWGTTAINTPYLNVSSFSPTGQVLSETMGNGAGLTNSYDSRLRIANSAYTIPTLTYIPPPRGSTLPGIYKIGTATAWSKGYTWTADNNLQLVSDPIAGIARQFTYDNLNRVISAQDIAGTVSSTGQTSDTSDPGAQENALISPQSLGGTYWGVGGASIVPNSVAAPDGSMTAYSMTATTGSTNSTIAAYSPTPTFFDNDTISASVWLRVPSGTLTTQIWIVDVGNGWAATKQSVTLNTTWQQFTIPGVAVQNGLITLALQIGGTNTIAASQVVDVWGAELEVATAPDTNILPSSQQIGAAGWQIVGGSVTATIVAAPDGSATASTVTSSSASATVSDLVVNPAQYNGHTVTGSIYLCLPTGSSPQSMNLYLADISGGTNANIASQPIQLTTTWQRFSVTGTAPSSLTQLSLVVGGGTPAFASGQVINMWGAQMVVGSTDGTYVATTDTTTNSSTGATEYLAANGLNESYAYDAFGNLQQTGNLTFEQAFTAANQLSGWSYDAAGNLLSNQISGSFTYDANGMVNTAGGINYYYDPLGNRVGKSGSNATDTIYFGGRPIARITGTAWTDLIYGTGGLLAEVPGTQSGAPVYRMLDHLGSEVGTLSSTGTVLNLQDYAPFGQVFSGSTQDPYQFTGKERDTESGLDYFGARYYASNMGRFASPDRYNANLIKQNMIAGGLPEAAAQSFFNGFIENPQKWNGYSYALNNPLRFIDRNGASAVDGHHLIPERDYINSPLGRDFTESVKSGRLSGNGVPNESFNTPHRDYNDAVSDLLDEAETKLGSSDNWSLTQWKDFANSVLNSDEPAIKDFLDELEHNNPGAKAAISASIASYQVSRTLALRIAAASAAAAAQAAAGRILSGFFVCFSCRILHFTTTSKII